jgi:hypothetical protein
MSTVARPSLGAYTAPAELAASATTAAPGVAWYVWAIVAAATCVVLGIIWDISWHMTVGRDGLFSPPHLSSYAGGAIVGLTCGWLALKTTFAGTEAERERSVRVWGFRAPLGAWVCVWGSFAMLTSAPFDDWWHNAYGLDVQIISPPHVLLLCGMLGIVVGALLMTASYQNGVTGAARVAPGRLYLYSMGLLVTMASVFATEYTERSAMHSPLFYQICAGAFPLLLVAAAVGGAVGRWPATTAALMYMAVRAVMTWVLPLFPGEPRLGPVFHHVTHFVPMEFPLLLAAPAFGIDLVMHRARAGADGGVRALSGLRGWLLAVALGAVFLLALGAVQWPFATFLMTPAARNRLFAAHEFAYMTGTTNYYATWRFFDPDPLAAWLRSALWALAFATLSARLGLGWGRWMSRVRR